MDLPSQPGHRQLRLLASHANAKPPQRVFVVGAWTRQVTRRKGHDGHPDLSAPRQSLEAGREHAHHLVGALVDPDFPTHDPGV